MEVYTLDSLWRRTAVIDVFESLIWTERFSAFGDFQLKMHATRSNRELLPIGTRIAINDSYRIMTVETIEDSTDDQGVSSLVFKGRSLEAIFESRLAWDALTDTTANPKWDITDQPADIIRTLFHTICVTGTLNAGDIIAANESSFLPTDTTPEPTDTITYSIEPMTLYQAFKDLSDVYNMGFRLILNPANNQLYFDPYMGSDRTSNQTSLPAVVFSPDFDNLRASTLLSSNALYKNVAYVFSPVGHEIVYDDDVDTSIAGFDRKVLMVNASDIDDGVPATASAKMIQRGKQELAKARKIVAFDGEISQTSMYKYGTDYNLGDLVEIWNDTGSASVMQVTEQIFVSDAEGERSYPTLVINNFITPGSYDDWTPDETFDTVDPFLAFDDL